MIIYLISFIFKVSVFCAYLQNEMLVLRKNDEIQLAGKTFVGKQLEADLGLVRIDANLVIQFAIEYAIAGTNLI